MWGMRLVLLTDASGVPVGYTLVAANEKEYEPVCELTASQAGCTLIADKGYWGCADAEMLALQDVTILTTDRVRTACNLEREIRLASPRLVIESTISNLKCQMRLEQHSRNARRTGAANRATAARAHHRHAPECTHRPPTPRSRRL